MKKRILSILLCLCMVLMLCPVAAFAEEPTGSLTITVEGFEVGKTPNDVTLSFDSTIPGVDFSAEDIVDSYWEMFDGYYHDLQDTDAFGAGTTYILYLKLSPKGLTSAPAATVNGNTPFTCVIQGLGRQVLSVYCDMGTPAERSQYTITYEGGEGAEGSIPAGVKTRGEDFTLSSDTFTLDGFIQTGWVDKETGAIYKLGATYDEDRDATLYPYWEKLITLTVPFTTTVKQGGSVAPGKTTFELGLVDSEGNELIFDNQLIGAEITTDGAGSYSGTMTITATRELALRDALLQRRVRVAV